MRVIGIDPGYDRCGVAVVEKKNGKIELTFSGCIETDRTLSVHERIYHIGKEISRIIAMYTPEVCAIEKLFFSKNQKTAMGVSETRGACMFVAHEHDLPIHEYLPAAVKIATTGSGNASKTQMIKMLPLLIEMNSHPAHDDEFDAIGIALTHLTTMKK